MKIEKGIPLPPPEKSLAIQIAEKMEVGDSVYFEQKSLQSSDVQRLLRALKTINRKGSSRQIYDTQEDFRRRKIVGVRVWRIE